MPTTLKIALPAFVAVLLTAAAGALPIPGKVDQPPIIALAIFAVIGFAGAGFGGFSLRGWLALAGGLLLGTAAAVMVAASLAQTYTFTDWFVARAGWIGGLSFSLLEVIVAAGAGYLAGGLTIARGRAQPGGPTRTKPKRLAVITAAVLGSLLAAPALVFALSATVIGDDLLAPVNRDIADISIVADGSLRISQDVLRAGSNWYMLSNATDGYIGLTMVPVDDETDVDRLLAGDQMGFTFMAFAEAMARQEPTLGRVSLEPGRYAVFVSPMPVEEGAVVGPEPAPLEPIQPSALVVIDVDE